MIGQIRVVSLVVALAGFPGLVACGVGPVRPTNCFGLTLLPEGASVVSGPVYILPGLS
jgi:hypothetical protein